MVLLFFVSWLVLLFFVVVFLCAFLHSAFFNVNYAFLPVCLPDNYFSRFLLLCRCCFFMAVVSLCVCACWFRLSSNECATHSLTQSLIRQLNPLPSVVAFLPLSFATFVVSFYF